MIASGTGQGIELIRWVTAAACAPAWEMVNPSVTTQEIDQALFAVNTPLVNEGAPQLLTGPGRISGMKS